MAKLIIGENDLASQYPAVTSEWDYTKHDTNPQDYAMNSKKRVWWKCHECGHSWCVQINSRTNGTGCPECGKTKSKKVELKIK